MAKKTVKLNEAQLRNIITESVTKVLREYTNQNIETVYRGYNSKYGSDNENGILWFTDDISYAKAYGNRVEEVQLDSNKLNAISIDELDGMSGLYDDFDYYDPDPKVLKRAFKEGYNCYWFEANSDSSDCLCLWDKSPIISRRELSREEFDAIEHYDGFKYWGYDDVYESAKTGLCEYTNQNVNSVSLKNETVYMPYIKYIQNNLTPRTVKVLEHAQIERLVSDEELFNFFSEGSAEDYEQHYMLYICHEGGESGTVKLADAQDVITIGRAKCNLNDLDSIAKAAVACLNKFGNMVIGRDI